MKNKQHETQTLKVARTDTCLREVVDAGHYRMLPLDNRRVTQLFTTHDRYRAILRAA